MNFSKYLSKQFYFAYLFYKYAITGWKYHTACVIAVLDSAASYVLSRGYDVNNNLKKYHVVIQS